MVKVKQNLLLVIGVLALIVIGKKINDGNKRVNNEHANNPPYFCFISYLLIKSRVNNHPYFEGKQQYDNYKKDWEPDAQVKSVMRIHIPGL